MTIYLKYFYFDFPFNYFRFENTEFAVKIIDKSKCQGKEAMLLREVSILRKVSHPNIIRLVEQYESDDYLFLVMEFIEVSHTYFIIKV